MQIIANNITTRNPRISAILRQGASTGSGGEPGACPGLQDVAQSCMAAGADVLEINLQQRYDDPEIMKIAVDTIQQAVDCQLCLSSYIPATLEAGIKLCRRPPIINYLAVDTKPIQEILYLTARYRTDLVLLVSDPTSLADARDMLGKAAILVGAAVAAGIPNERLILDPGVSHVTKEPGQRHLVEVLEFLKAVPETFDPPVRTTCWINNSSSGAGSRLRPVIESSLLFLLSGLGLSSAFIDVLRRENSRAIRLLKIFHNEKIYADAALAL